MRWVRSQVRGGAYLALFALALQLVVSFAHVHLHGTAPLTASVSAQVAADAPEDPGSNGIIVDRCAVCTLIQMAGALVPAASPSLPLPVIVSPLRLAAGIDRERPASPPPLFQARAPPIA
jgi:hypothetical protein